MKVTIKGQDVVTANMKKKLDKIGDSLRPALLRAGLRLQRESQKMVPVNFGVLKASAYTRAEGKGMDTRVSVGYTASYALFVHEAVGMVLAGQPRPQGRGLYWDPQGQAQAKFLETPMRTLKKQMYADIREAMKL